MKKSVGKWLFIGSTLTTFLLVGCAYLFAPVAKLLSRQRTISIGYTAVRIVAQPNCEIFRLTSEPSSNMKALYMEVHFEDSISTAVVQSSIGRGKYHFSEGSVNIGTPCIVTSTTVSSNNLSFAMSLDNHNIIVSGKDLRPFHDDTFIAALYRSEPSRPTKFTASGNATYMAFGHELPAILMLVNGDTGGREVLSK